MKKILLLLAVAGMAVAGCRSDEDSNYNNRNNSTYSTNYNNGGSMNQPGTYPNQNMDKNAPPNQSGNGNTPQQ